MSFRDRFFTPQVARAITSPSGILLAGAGAAAAILVGGLTPIAVLAGAAAWAARVAVAVPRRQPGAAVDAFRVGEPWREFVLDAQRAQRRFAETVERCRPGPVRDRLRAVGERVDDAVAESWRIARQGDQLVAALRTLDVRDVEAQLRAVHEERRRVAGDRQADAALYRTQQALESQLASADRVRDVARDAENRLRLLNAQLDEAVARSVEISLQASDAGELGALTDDVESVVGELESLRSALEETSGVAGATGGTATSGTS